MKSRISKIFIVGIMFTILVTLTGCGNKNVVNKNESNENTNSENIQTAKEESTNMEEIYKEYIRDKKYTSYTNQWQSEAQKYCIFDINQDGIKELMIRSKEPDFYNTLFFSYDKEKNEIIFIKDIYSYGEVRYSEENKEIVYAEFKPFKTAGGYTFSKLNDNKFEIAKTVGYDYEQYFIDTPNEGKKDITKSESEAYYKNLTYFEYLDISTVQTTEAEQSTEQENKTQIEEKNNNNNVTSDGVKAGEYTLQYGTYKSDINTSMGGNITIKSDGTFTYYNEVKKQVWDKEKKVWTETTDVQEVIDKTGTYKVYYSEGDEYDSTKAWIIYFQFASGQSEDNMAFDVTGNNTFSARQYQNTFTYIGN